MSMFVGEKELLALMQEMANKRIPLSAKTALRKGLRAIAKSQQRQVPDEYSHLAKTIGSRLGKAKRGPSKGLDEGKAGFGVGKKRTRKTRSGERVATRVATSRKLRPGEKRRGTGLSLQNVHWIVLGTKNRTQKSGPKKSVGSMPPLLERVVPDGTKAAIPEAVRLIKASMRASIARIKSR